MLIQLRIESLAILSHTDLSLSPGFSVITGESGAGKSVLFQALRLLMGYPSKDTWISSQEDSALVEGVFDCQNAHLSDLLRDFLGDETQLVIFRQLHRHKANIVRVNQQSVSLKFLRSLMSDLIMMVGQHDALQLLDTDYQRQLLDQFDPQTITPLYRCYQSAYADYKQAQDRYQHAQTGAQNSQQELDFLAFKIQELTQLDLTPDEEERLNETRDRLRHMSLLTRTFNNLDHHVKKIQASSTAAHSESGSIAHINPEYEKWVQGFFELDLAAQDLHDKLQSQRHELNTHQEGNLDDVEARLAEIFKFKQKYHTQNPNELLDLLATFKQEFDEKSQLLLDPESLLKAVETSKETAIQAGDALHQAREKIAQRLSNQLCKSLQDLSFPYAQVAFEMCPLSSVLGPNGTHSVQLTFSPNPGEPLKPIQEAASGGELSRLMLAILTLPCDAQPPTFIFDEIDAGIGGITAKNVGQYLAQLGDTHQVICISHLVQVAQSAHHHLSVSKHQSPQRTYSEINCLNDAQRLDEQERMLGQVKQKALSPQ